MSFISGQIFNTLNKTQFGADLNEPQKQLTFFAPANTNFDGQVKQTSPTTPICSLN